MNAFQGGWYGGDKTTVMVEVRKRRIERKKQPEKRKRGFGRG